ncbi:MAG: sigma factor-like helix-turn-helix DNA-binding protein [Candidatus Paceibacterota bacterium]|jgi:hypothetical protein
MIQADKIFNNLLEDLSPRQKEVICGRFNIDNKYNEPQTLAALGEKYGVTRERIRQIEAGSLVNLKRKIAQNKECNEILSSGQKVLANAGGLVKSDVLLASLNNQFSGLTQDHLSLLLEVSKNFHFYGEDKDFNSFYYIDKNKFAAADKLINQFVKSLRQQKEAILAGGYFDSFKKFVVAQEIKESIFQNFLNVSKKIHKSTLNDVGLSEWPEIKPQNIRDRIYLILKKNNKPLHFETITKLINESKFDSKIALTPTVHNELIKDSRFILVGRGTYALAENGYKPGTVQEVIKRIIKSDGPMRPKEISLAVEKERILKPNTILVNLQNRKVFSRLSDGRYTIREA